MSDLKMNPLGGNESSNQPNSKSVRMHVMPDNILNQEELYQKVSKAGQIVEVKEAPGKPLTATTSSTPVSPTPPPATFTRPSAPATSSGKNKKFIIIIVILLLLGGGAFGAWYWWSKHQEDDANMAELERIAEEQRLAEELRLAEEQKATAEAEKLLEENRQKEERDRQRINDVIVRQEALNLYFEKNQKYPETLPESGEWEEEEIIYAQELQADPIDDNAYKYVYVRGTEKSYTLTVRFEIGFNKINAGINIFDETLKLKNDGSIEEVKKLPDPELPTIISALDTDGDGLSDEEEDLYKSDINLSDTDNDTYEDSLEIKNLYSPSHTAPQTLLDAGLVAEFISEIQSYKLLYPISWKMQKIDPDDSNIIFISANPLEYVEFKIEENEGKLPLTQWVKLKLATMPLKFKAIYSDEIFENKDQSLQGILIPEFYMAFFAKGNKIYSLTYQFDPTKPLAYETTFLMFAKSFHLFTQELNLPDNQSTEEIEMNDTTIDETLANFEEDSILEDSESDILSENTPNEEAFNDVLNEFFSEAEDVEDTEYVDEIEDIDDEVEKTDTLAEESNELDEDEIEYSDIDL